MNRFAFQVLPLVLFLLEAILSLPDVGAAVSKAVGTTNLMFGAWIAVALFALLAINQLWYVRRQFVRFELFEVTKQDLLEQNANRLIAAYRKKHKIHLRVNVMIVRRRVACLREPFGFNRHWRKPRLFARCLQPVWVSQSMIHDGDSDVRFTIRQGACGLAFRNKERVIVDFSETDDVDFLLSFDQVEKTRGLRFLLSHPIRNIDPKTNKVTTGVIGVLNIDSRTDGSETLVRNPSLLKTLVSEAEDFSTICSRLY